VSDEFRRALEMLKMGRVPNYGLLGVEPAPVALEQRQRGRSGAQIRSVMDATPAKLVGLRGGDVITEIDGLPIADDMDLIRRVSGQLADTTISLSILRGGAGRPTNVKVKLSKKRIDSARAAFAEVPPPTWRGVRVEYATAAPLFNERSRDLDPGGSVGVVEVARDSAAWKAGLRPGDFVSHVGESRVTTPSEFYRATAGFGGDAALRLCGVERDNAIRTVPAEEP